jgi:hypothetical protein
MHGVPCWEVAFLVGRERYDLLFYWIAYSVDCTACPAGQSLFFSSKKK